MSCTANDNGRLRLWQITPPPRNGAFAAPTDFAADERALISLAVTLDRRCRDAPPRQDDAEVHESVPVDSDRSEAVVHLLESRQTAPANLVRSAMSLSEFYVRIAEKQQGFSLQHSKTRIVNRYRSYRCPEQLAS